MEGAAPRPQCGIERKRADKSSSDTVKWILAEPLIAIYVDGLDRVDDSSVYRTAS
jgi:hypothetical protein